jgi:IS30 family transposase
VAQRLSETRRYKQHRGKLDKHPELKALVVAGLKNEWSPDVVAGKLKVDGSRYTISHESIYHYIYNKGGREEKLYQYLRQAQPKRHKLHSRKKCKLRILERQSIHLRPTYINDRKRYGDWESDSVIFSKQKTILSVQSERKSKLIRIHKATDKSAEETKNALSKTAESVPKELF